jgi:hypothetical protein
VVYLYNLTGLVNKTIASANNITLNFTGLPDATYYLNATANDTAGNINQTETRQITINTTLCIRLFLDGLEMDRDYEIGYNANLTAAITDFIGYGINGNYSVCISMNATAENETWCGTSPFTLNWTVLPAIYMFNTTYISSKKNITANETLYFGGGTHMDEVLEPKLNLTCYCNSSSDGWGKDIYIDMKNDGIDDIALIGQCISNYVHVNETTEKNVTMNMSLSPLLIYYNLSTYVLNYLTNMTLIPYTQRTDTNYDATTVKYTASRSQSGAEAVPDNQNINYAFDGNISTYAIIGVTYNDNFGSYSYDVSIIENFTMLSTTTSINVTQIYSCTGTGQGVQTVEAYLKNVTSNAWVNITSTGAASNNVSDFYNNGLVEVKSYIHIYGNSPTTDYSYCNYYETGVWLHAYPDVIVDVLNDGTYELNKTDGLNTTANFAMNYSAINDYLADDDNCPGLSCLIPVIIFSELGGIINLNMTVINATFNPIDLNKTVVSSYTQTKLDIPVNIHAEDYGIIELTKLNVTYYGYSTVEVNATGIGNMTTHKLNTYIIFIPKTNSSKNVTPWGQNYRVPIMNITGNAYDRDFYIGAMLNGTDSCFNMTVSNTSSKNDGFLLTTSFANILNMTQYGNVGLWLWADMNDCNESISHYEPYKFMRPYCQGCVVSW